jgi:hypothetical protein
MLSENNVSIVRISPGEIAPLARGEIWSFQGIDKRLIVGTGKNFDNVHGMEL